MHLSFRKMDTEPLCIDASLFVGYVSYHIRNTLLDAVWKCHFKDFFSNIHSLTSSLKRFLYVLLYLPVLLHAHNYFQYKMHSWKGRNNAFHLGRWGSNERENTEILDGLMYYRKALLHLNKILTFKSHIPQVTF